MRINTFDPQFHIKKVRLLDRNRQAKARARRLLGIFTPGERLKELGHFIDRDPWSGIFDRNHDVLGV